MALPPAWRVCESVEVLHWQLRPLAPGAPATTFGTVADSEHSASSDHYPKMLPGLGAIPVVTALDFPNGWGLDSHAVLESIRQSRDDRVKYAISNKHMYSSYPSGSYPPYTWRPYSGKDPHDTHGHLSVVGDARADDKRSWVIDGGNDMPLTDADVQKIYTWDLVDGPDKQMAYHIFLEIRDTLRALKAEPPINVPELARLIASDPDFRAAVAESVSGTALAETLERTRFAVVPPPTSGG